MDTELLAVVPRLIAGGASGLDKVAAALRGAGVVLDGVYLIRLTDSEGNKDWVLRLVSPERDKRKVLFPAADLQRVGGLPAIDDRVRFSHVLPDHPEASRILSYARHYERRPLELEHAGIDGLYVDYALIGSSVPFLAQAESA